MAGTASIKNETISGIGRSSAFQRHVRFLESSMEKLAPPFAKTLTVSNDPYLTAKKIGVLQLIQQRMVQVIIKPGILGLSYFFKMRSFFKDDIEAKMG